MSYNLKIVDPCAKFTVDGKEVPPGIADKPVKLIIELSRSVANETDTKTKSVLDGEGNPTGETEKVPLTEKERVDHYIHRATNFLNDKREANAKGDIEAERASAIAAVNAQFDRLEKPTVDETE